MSQHAKTLEEMGIPTLGAAGANIVNYAIGYNFKYTNGMPIRYVGFPFPVAGQPREVLHNYVYNSKDTVSGKPMMEAVVDAFTKPLTEEEKISGKPPEAAPEPRLLPPDTADNLQQLFKDKDWTDYNAIILPTEEKVAAMLKGTSHAPDEVVAKLSWPGGMRTLTVEKAAVCAVMVGAKPEYFPLILALATQTGSFGNSTSSMANMILVNGPVRNEVHMNYGANVMGPHSEVNSVLGRVFTILAKTAGNIHAPIHSPDITATTFSTLGSNLQYDNVCIAENEEGLPEGWKSFSVQRGFKETDSVVSVGTGWSYISSVGEVQVGYAPQNLMRDYMRSLTGMGASVVMDPTVAALLKETQGFNTKEDLAKWLADNVQKTVASYWGNGVVSTMYSTMAIQGLEPYASQRKLPPNTMMKPFQPRGIGVIVTGGGIQTTWFVTDFRPGRGALVDDWK